MFDLSARAQEIRERLLAFMREAVEPGERGPVAGEWRVS